MKKIAWTPKSLRAYKRLIRQNPQLRTAIEETLRQLASDPFHPTLKTHKLSGEFDSIWSASIDQADEFISILQRETNLLKSLLQKHDLN